MTYYELINPSDTYTLKADDPQIAVLAAILLGSGRYGLTDEESREIFPIFFIDANGLEEWVRVQYSCELGELIKAADKAALAACLESVAICPLKDRRLWDAALEAMDDAAKRAAWLAAWHDAQRSSMNDIGGRAQKYAAHFRALAAGTVTVTS